MPRPALLAAGSLLAVLAASPLAAQATAHPAHDSTHHATMAKGAHAAHDSTHHAAMAKGAHAAHDSTHHAAMAKGAHGAHDASHHAVTARDTTAAARAAAQAAADSAVQALGKAMGELATSVQKVIAETANKPELRLAAVQVAGRAVTLAQATLEENMSEIEKALADATRVLAEAEAAQKRKVEKP